MDNLEKILMEEIDKRIEIIDDDQYIFPPRLSAVDWIGLAIIFLICLAVIIFQVVRLVNL